MLRLLFLVGRDASHPQAGGGDIQAWEWARYMAARGHEVIYVCSAHATLPRTEQIEGVDVIRPGTGVVLALRAYAFAMRQRRRFDLVYEDVIGGSRPPYLAPLYVRRPVIAAWHQVNGPLFHDSYPRPLAFLLTYAEKLLARCYRNALVRAPSSERAQELHRELGLPLERIHVIPASVPDSWFGHADAGSARERNEALILCLGNLRPYKEFHRVIEALPHVLRACPDAQLVIAGRRYDEAYEQRLRSLASDLGVADRVTFQLDISEEEKRALIRRSALLALPSRLEGFGIVVLEANACGVPVVASSGVPEDAVRHEYNGLRYRADDVAALGNSIVRLLQDDGLWRRLSLNASNFAAQFGWQSIGARFETLAHLALSDQGKTGCRCSAVP